MLSIDLSIQQGTDEIVLGLSPALLNHVEEILAHFCLRVASFREGRADNGIRPDLEAFTVLLWNPQHFRNHDPGDWLGRSRTVYVGPLGSTVARMAIKMAVNRL